MTLGSLLVLLLIAAVCGALGQAIAGYSLGGCVVSIAVGFIGALVGVWLSSAVGLPELFVIQVGGHPSPSSGRSSARYSRVAVGLISRRRY